MRKFNSNIRIAKTAVSVGLFACFLLLPVAQAQGAGQYEIPWHTIDGGGGQSSGGPYQLIGTIGQPDAAWSAGDNYELLGGFLVGGPLCFVEFEDFARFALYWMQTGAGLPADLHEDGVIDYDDLSMFVDVWLNTCPYNWPLK